MCTSNTAANVYCQLIVMGVHKIENLEFPLLETALQYLQLGPAPEFHAWAAAPRLTRKQSQNNKFLTGVTYREAMT